MNKNKNPWKWNYEREETVWTYRRGSWKLINPRNSLSKMEVFVGRVVEWQDKF